MSEQPHHAEETPVRQGRTGTGLRWVLRISLALIVIAFAMIWLSYSGRGHEPSPAQVASTAPHGVTSSTAPGLAGHKDQTSGG